MYIISNNEFSQNPSEIDKLLQQNVGKEVLIKLKSNITAKGKLKNFDQHLNLSLKDGNIKSKQKTESFDNMLLRGSDILMVSLSNYDYSKPKQ
ncbi:MAG: LSM domain-containing protein [Nitrosopumilaceae archaeon]